MLERPATGYVLEFQVLTSVRSVRADAASSSCLHVHGCLSLEIQDDPPLAIEGTLTVFSDFFSAEVRPPSICYSPSEPHF
jgi:hypothetical protein